MLHCVSLWDYQNVTVYQFEQAPLMWGFLIPLSVCISTRKKIKKVLKYGRFGTVIVVYR